MSTPTEAECEHCKQTRTLFRYQPEHNAHAIPVICEWCDRETQPLLCTRCWGNERQREENMPVSAEEDVATAFLYAAIARNGRLIRQSEKASA